MKAIITGATSGIGLEVAKILLQQGWSLGLAGRRVERLADLQAAYPSQVKIARIDVCSPEATEAWLQLAAELGEVDLYLHSSGVGWYNPELDAQKELATATTNAEGFIRMMNVAYLYFKRTGHGHIAAISSIAGTRGIGPAPAYSATKKLQHTYLQALAQLSRRDGIHLDITDIRPGFVRTDFIAGSNFPMQMEVTDVAKAIVRAIKHRQRIVTIDWRYRLLVALWRLIPRPIWERMRL